MCSPCLVTLEHKSSSIFRFRRKPSTKWCPRRALFRGSCLPAGRARFWSYVHFSCMGLSRHFWGLECHFAWQVQDIGDFFIRVAGVVLSWEVVSEVISRGELGREISNTWWFAWQARCFGCLGPVCRCSRDLDEKVPETWGQTSFSHFQSSIVCDVRNIDWTSNICSCNPLVTLCVSDRSGCGAVLSFEIARSLLSQPSCRFETLWVSDRSGCGGAHFWDRGRNPLITLCVSDRSGMII